ncbi:MAG: flagellar biosynthetic protein FliO [Rhodocyclaceae bacterium]
MRLISQSRLLLACVLWAPVHGLQAQQSEAATSRTPIVYRASEPVSDISASGAVLGALLLGGAALSAWLLARKRGVKLQLRGFRNERLKVLETLHLSSRSRIYLVEVDGELRLVGESATGLSISSVASKASSDKVSRELPEV